MVAESLPLATKAILISKLEDINTLLDHRFTDEEIQEKLTRSGALQAKFASVERTVLRARRNSAESRGDLTTVAKCDAELAKLEGPKLAFGTTMNTSPRKPPVSTGPDQQERLAALNRANRKANQQDVRRAQHKERRIEAANQAAVDRGEADPNPFARVKTRAKTHYDVQGDSLAPPVSKQALDDLFGGNSDRSRAGTPLTTSGVNTPAKVDTPKKSGTPAAGTPKIRSRAGTPLLNKQGGGEKKGGLPGIRRKNMDDDLIAAMDLGIEIDI